MHLITYIIVQILNWLFRKRSPALSIFRAGLTLTTLTLTGGLGLIVQYVSSSQVFSINVGNSEMPSMLTSISFCTGIVLTITGAAWEYYRWRIERRQLAKQVVLTIEQRGLVNTSDTPLAEYSQEKYKGQNIANVVIDIRDRLVNGTISQPEQALKKFLNLEHSIEERRNNIATEDFHIVYGGLVPIPFAFLSGHLLDDESPIEVLDWDRQTSCWRALDTINDDQEKFEVIKKQATRKDAVVLAVSFSYLVDEKAIDQCFPTMPQVHLQLATKRFDNHWSSKKQSRLAYDLIEEVKSLMADGYEEIHLVLASQNSVAFKFGQAYDRRNLPPITIYQYERNDDVPYPWGVHINNVAHSTPSIITTPSNGHLKRAV